MSHLEPSDEPSRPVSAGPRSRKKRAPKKVAAAPAPLRPKTRPPRSPLQRHRHPLARWSHDRGPQEGCFCTASRKSPISLRLLTTLWARNRPPLSRRGGSTGRRNACSPSSTRRGRRSRTCPQPRDLRERVARHDADDVGQARALDVRCQLLGAPRDRTSIRDEPAAGLAQPHADPDRAVAAGPADFERVLRASLSRPSGAGTARPPRRPPAGRCPST